MRTPLQIVVIRDRANRRTEVYVDTLRLAFEGSADSAGSSSAYLSDAVDLGIRVLEPAEALGEQEAMRLLRGARHTIIVVIGEPSDRGKLLLERIDGDRKVEIHLPPDVTNGEIQGEKATDGVEPAFAPVVATLRTMERARQLLFRRIEGLEKSAGILKLFISHAKIDGIAMAKSLIGLLRLLREVDTKQHRFAYFYDDEHIEPGSLWRKVLEAEAGQSMLIALRTEAYESRYWCRREFLLAERNGMPILVVDLRKEQYHDCALLPFEVAPTVRVHDGNLIRVILHAMAAHLRALRVRSEAPRGVKVLPHRPSVYSLGEVSQRDGGELTIAYPGPKLSDAYARAVKPMLTQGESPVKLVTFDELEDN